jgi:gamma-glutamyltranspeptidase / glutathione hydrolase
MSAYRPVITGTRHMISAGHHAAAHAGFAILEAGGNAIDAGVAAGIALGVLQTDLVGFAGVAPMMIYLAERQEVINIDGLGTWPRAVTPDFFMKNHGGKMPPGILRTVMPAAPDAWITALARYGTMRFGEVAAAAIRFARDGFPMYPLMLEHIVEHEAAYRRWPSSAEVFLPGGRPPRLGEVFVQRDLGRTLQYLADEEAAHASRGRSAGLKAARDAFYRGDIAAAIVKYHRENGGFVSAEDLASFRVRFETPLKGSYAGLDLYACGPWCQGPLLLQTLNVLGGFDLKALGHNSANYIHTLAEALKLAFADRHRYYGDPQFVNVPIDTLLSREYAERRRAMIRSDVASPGMPEAGSIEGYPSFKQAPREAAADAPVHIPDTSYVAVIDRHGNAFSATPSDGSSATPVIPGTGLCPSSRGSQSWCDPQHPASVAPGKRPRLTPSPALALKDGKAYMPFGSPGNDVQPQAMLQVLLNITVFGMDVQSACEAPRFASYSYPASSEPHAYHAGRLNLEARIARETADDLAQRGHKIAWWPEIEWRAGAVCLVRRNDAGVLESAADPRRPAYALGW